MNTISLKNFIDLVSDCGRRDFTFNAIAMDPISNEIIDPYNGRQDIELKVIRHVSSHFREDPLRVLRACRFYARYLNFSIHPETMNMMQFMVESGELNELSRDRVWKEVDKVLITKAPWKFFEALKECGALQILFPELVKINWTEIAKSMVSYTTPTSKFACVVNKLSDDKRKSLVERYPFPSQYIKYFERLAIFKKWDKKETGESIVSLFNILCNNQNNSIAVEQCCGFYKIQNVISDDFVKRIIDYRRLYFSVKFEHLSEEQKTTLKGKQITEALNQERIRRIDNYISNMQFTKI